MWNDDKDFRPFNDDDSDVPPYEQSDFPQRFYSFLTIGLIVVICLILLYIMFIILYINSAGQLRT